eukprot:gene28558-34470_t
MCPEGVLNDGYCDCLDGSDENITSACSHVGATFLCPNAGFGRVPIPTSRVADGICDCCDGSDEALSPFNTSCPNFCQEELNKQRREALQMYRTIQAGLHNRHSLIRAHASKNQGYAQSLESLQLEQQELESYAKTLRHHLQRETLYEDQMRWILLRERAHHCANGMEVYCQGLFRASFFNDDELQDYGFQAGMKKEKKDKKDQAQRKNSQIDLTKRFVYTHSSSEIAFVHAQKGMSKVRSSLCYNTSLLPDEDLRIFTTVGDYVSFMASPGGRVYKQKLHTRYKREQSIFTMQTPYNAPSPAPAGTLPPNMAYIRVSEALGVLASPLVGVVYVSTNVYDYVSKIVYNAIHGFHTSYKQSRNLQSSDEVYYRSIRGVSDVLAKFTQVLVDMDDENSFIYRNLITYIYSDYNPLYTLYNIVADYLYYPIYTYTLMYYAPYMYYMYYTRTPLQTYTPGETGAHADDAMSYELLPQRRQCCLLRTGLGYLQEELAKINKKIQALVQLQSMKDQMLAGNDEDGDGDIAKSKESSKRTQKPWSVKNTILSIQQMFGRQKDERRRRRDYGLLGEYESIKDVCVSQVFEAYNYSVCFFDTVTQTKVSDGAEASQSKKKEVYSLGKFSMWNAHESSAQGYSTLNTYRAIQRQQLSQQQRTQHVSDSADGSTYTRMVSIAGEFWDSLAILPSYFFEKFVLNGLKQDDVGFVRGLLPLNDTFYSYYDSVVEYVHMYNQSIYVKAGLLTADAQSQTAEVQEIQHKLHREMDMYYGKQFYTDGTPCVLHGSSSAHSKQTILRNSEVILQCAPEHALVSVFEK